MFTRYTVPKNYGGSRFSQPSYETETKLHTASNVKTSISPLFNQENTATPLKEIENPPFFTVDEDLSEDEARDSIRTSFSHMQGTSEVLQAAKVIAQCVATLRGGV